MILIRIFTKTNAPSGVVQYTGTDIQYKTHGRRRGQSGKTDRLAQRIPSSLPMASYRRGEKRREWAVPSLPLSPKAPASRGCGRQGRPPVYPAAAVPVRDAARGSVRTHFRSPFFWTRWERTPALSSALPICSTE